MGILQKDENDHPVSIVISKVAWNTPASRAHLRQGDLILAMNNIDIQKHSYEDLVNIIRNSHQLELVIQRRSAMEESLENIRVNLSAEQFEVGGRERRSFDNLCYYQALPRRKDAFTFEIASQQTNFYHNRYKDVLPYDQTRVKLEHDYINANHIDVRQMN